MPHLRSLRPVLFLFGVALLAPGARGAEPFRYPEGRHGKGELKYVNDLPVLRVEGTPEEIGEQTAALTAKPAARLLGYPRELLKTHGLEKTWPLLLRMGKGMLPQFPPDHLRELEAAVKHSGVDRDLLVAANTMFDIKKIGGCSTLIVEPGRSATGGPLFGRNLDFPTLGFLQEYSLVTVYRPQGKYALASVGFPGLLGVLSGMNDAGLAVAVLEVYSSADGAPRLDTRGTPYALCFRCVLEECKTVAEAEKLLRATPRTTMLNLAVCDRKGGAVFEITPKSVVVRPPAEDLCLCTNHFRSKELATSLGCRRFRTLEETRKLAHVGLPDIARQLHAVNQGAFTLQTMVFEPATLKLHLALGPCPTSALPLKTLELARLFGEGGTRAAGK
jgi:isopenicillin-N N-acyltransferase-like protein